MWTVAPEMGLRELAAVTVPCSMRGAGPPGDWSTAAKASRRPSPQTLLSAAVPPQDRSLTSTAVLSRIARVALMSLTSTGDFDHISATVPATCGPAIEVPLRTPNELAGRRLPT